jgi:myo-inositol-1(or 4)-monophosphatase
VATLDFGEALAPYETGAQLPQASDDLRFTVGFVRKAGQHMVGARTEAFVSKKLDKTAVTDVDTLINTWFIEAVRDHAGDRASVLGEEASARVEGSEETWVIDPVDGTGEYIRPDIPDSERSSCIGAAMLRNGQAQLSVVLNPFRNELFVADRDLGGAFLNGQRLDLQQTEAGQTTFGPDIPYDYTHWQGAASDPRFFEELVGRPPIGSHSAIYQACDVARGRSTFDVFSGNTIHDIAPGAVIVELAGGAVSDVDGRNLNWGNLHGAVYASNRQILGRVVGELIDRA